MEKEWKVKKQGEYEIYYIDFPNEKSHEKSDRENKRESKTANVISDDRPRIEIIKIDDRRIERIIGIILAKDNDIIGLSEIHIMEDNNANICTRGLLEAQTTLPGNLTIDNEELKHYNAIFIRDKYQRNGYGTNLLEIILRYLKSINIDTLEVSGIVQSDKAKKFYERTGAHFINNTNAKYDVTETLEFLKSKKDVREDSEQRQYI